MTKPGLVPMMGCMEFNRNEGSNMNDVQRFTEWARELGIDDATIDNIVEDARRGQYGRSRTPRSMGVVSGYCSFYWGNKVYADVHEHDGAALILKAYRAWLADEDAARGWTEYDRVHYADNSIVALEAAQDGTGETRQRTLVAPHGDVC